MKSFSAMRDTQRGSQSYMEKKRGRREIEVTEKKRGGIKKGESKLASDHFPMCSPQSGSLRDVHGVTEKRRGRKETKVTRRIQPVISSINVLHSPEHTQRFTELGREEKGEGGDRGSLVEKKSQKGERAIRPVISLPSKNGY